MIRVWIRGVPGSIKGFMIWGHARTAPWGEDVVCAGISAVAATALAGLILRTKGRTRVFLSTQGFMYCRIPDSLSQAQAREVKAILETMVLGLLLIRNNYKANIDIAFRR